jgi:pyruvate dehydrogenase E2 component (dihydrolipoamide acetyltransferase)
MIREVFMPALSSTMTEGKIVSWVKAPGDKVEKGETVVIVESDKADMDVESFYEGFLAAIVVDAGDVAPVGDAIALLAETEAEIEEAKAKAASAGGGNSAPAAAAPPAAATPAPDGSRPCCCDGCRPCP